MPLEIEKIEKTEKVAKPTDAAEPQEPVDQESTQVEQPEQEARSVFDRNRAMNTIRKMREEIRELRQRARDEAETAQAQLSAAQQESRQVLIRAALVAQAARAGFHDPEDAWRMVDSGKLSIDTSGAVSGIAEALAELASAKPYLIRQGGSGAQIPIPGAQAAPGVLTRTSLSAGNPASTTRVTLDDIRHMTPDEINRNWEQIRQILGG
jgi:hypothetical protein